MEPFRRVIPAGFPHQLSDAELEETLTWMVDPANLPGFAEPFTRLLPELKLELLASGLRERDRRGSAAAAKTALRVAYATLGVSVVAVIAAIAVSVITA